MLTSVNVTMRQRKKVRMTQLTRFLTARMVALGVLLAIIVGAVIVIVVASLAPTPEPAAPPTTAATAVPTTAAATAVPWTGHVIGVMAVPRSWRSLGTAELPFSMGYPPSWHLRRLSAGATPRVQLTDEARHRTLTISGKRLRTAVERRSAVTALAFTPVPGTLNPSIYIRSYPYVPVKTMVTTTVAFEQGGYLWTVSMVQPQDVHLIEGLHALQSMLATFHVI